MAKGYSTDDPWRNAMVGMNFLGNAMRTGQQIGEVRHEQDERDAVNKAREICRRWAMIRFCLPGMERRPRASSWMIGSRRNLRVFRC